MLTNFGFLAEGQHWPPESESERLLTYAQNRHLFNGDHQMVYSNWVRLVRDDQKATLEIIFNFHKRLSKLWADLLLGEPPLIVSPEAQEDVDRLVELNEFLVNAYEVALDISRYGTGIFKVRYADRSIIEAIPPTIWFPVVDRDNVKDIQAHVLAWCYEEEVPGFAGFGTTKKKYLKTETHFKDRIEYKLFAVKGDKISVLLDERTEWHNLGEFLIIPIHNLTTSDSCYGVSDYEDLDAILQEIELRFSQISRILDKHADPNMYGPDSALELDPETGMYTFRGGGKYFPVAEGEDPPGYVTWEGKLDEAFTEVKHLMDQLYLVSETNPTAFGIAEGSRAESGSALKRLLMAPLAHVNRIRLRFDPGVKKVIKLANRLEIEFGYPNAKKIEKLQIVWQDGLPKDDKEVSEIETALYGVGLTSLRSSVARLTGLEGDALEEEVRRIQEDEKRQSELKIDRRNSSAKLDGTSAQRQQRSNQQNSAD